MNVPRRDAAAQLAHRLGITSLLALLPAKPALIVLNYHRIGNATEAVYAPQVYSATPEEFEDQVRFLKKHFHLASLDEALDMVERPSHSSHSSILFTFDDGYLDNHQLAFPILSNHGAQGVFFLVTSFVGSHHIPWWDQIAYMIKHAKRKRFALGEVPGPEYDTTAGPIDRVVSAVQARFKQSGESSEVFLASLEKALDTPRPSGSERCFLNWEEAAEMVRGGMAIGSHTHRHEILSSLSEEGQREELIVSKKILEEKLGISGTSLAYPVGLRDSFSIITRTAARSAGYRGGFSFYGGFNKPGKMDRFDIHRVAVSSGVPSRFRLQTVLARLTGKYWF